MSALKYQKVITKEFTNRVTPSLVSMASVAVLSLWTAPGLAQESSAGGIEVAVAPEAVQASSQVEEILVTARRREESVQEVPIPISVVDDALLTQTGAFNVNRLKELIPTVQFYSTNPRNSAINIRGLGAPYGLTNDGLEPGVGLYVDGVFNAPGRRDAGLHRRAADRSAARPAGHAVRQEHHRRRDQRHHQEAELHARNAL
ncbi:TonB-dependent receptor plug domain-containing protein [Hydrocarboniphaga effusa]|uniref:TonB-dependent receptor plug domain-containing protein n=1 Tax=Hydrocarboniphaga effusa TaxID=243629 RepID=UPI00398BE24E